MKKLVYSVIMASAFAVTNQAQAQVDTTRSTGQTVTANASNAFVNSAASSGRFEIEAGRIAKEKTQNLRFRDYGSMMEKEHTQVNQELTDLAARKGWQITNDLTEQQQNDLDRLRSLDGEEFERTYADLMQASHQNAITLFEGAATTEQDADLKNWASGKIHSLRSHLDQAKGLMGNQNETMDNMIDPSNQPLNNGSNNETNNSGKKRQGP